MAKAKKEEKSEKLLTKKLDPQKTDKGVGTGKGTHIKKGQEVKLNGELAEILLKKGVIEIK